MEARKNSNESIEKILNYYGVSTAEYAVFDEDIVQEPCIPPYIDTGQVSTSYVDTTIGASIDDFLPQMERSSPLSRFYNQYSFLYYITSFFSRIPIQYLCFIFLSLISFYLGITIWNAAGGRTEHLSRKAIFNGLATVELSPLSPIKEVQEEPLIDSSFIDEFSMKQYTIQQGDTLLELAIRFGLNVDTLVSINNIQDATLIQYGKELFIPNSDGILHTVKRRENIGSIAREYGVNETAVVDINNLKNALLMPGKQLFIPNVKMDQFELGLILGTIFLVPTKGRLSSGYGYRISPITGRWHFHSAIDIVNNVGTRILAAATGYVSNVSNSNPVYGKYIEIRHPNNYSTLYSHLSKIYVRTGQRITRGAVIGLMGNTGYSTGPHLHFALYKNGKPINPLKYIRFR